MSEYWLCEDCKARFKEPIIMDNTVIKCPNCKSLQINKKS